VCYSLILQQGRLPSLREYAPMSQS